MKNKNHTTIAKTFKNIPLIAVISTAALISIIISYIEYNDFLKHSKQLESQYTSEKKELIKQEVLKVTRYINQVRNKTHIKIKERIKKRVYEAHVVASNIYNQFHKKLPEQQVKKLIIEALRPLRFFNNKGYYFIHSLGGTLQLHSLFPSLEGINRLNFKDSDGEYIFQKLLKAMKESGEGYLSYKYHSPDSKQKERLKISFVKKFTPYNWSIGTGDYIKNIEQDMQKELLEYISKIRFGENGYIFIVNYRDKVILHPVQKELINSNISSLTNPNGVNIFEAQREAIKNPKGDFIHYVWNKPSSSKPSPKITFMKSIPDWQWMIGSDLYVDDAQKSIQQQREYLKNELLQQTIYILLTIVIISLFIIHLSNKFINKFNSEFEVLLSFFTKAYEKEEKINIESLRFVEFKELAISANKMLSQKNKTEKSLRNSEEQLKRTQKMDALGKLVGGIAHDYNNMMGVVIGYSSMLLNLVKGKKEETKYVARIKEAAERAHALTEKLMTFSRFKSSSTEILDLNEELLQQQQLLEKTLTARIHLSLNLTKDIWPVNIDRGDFNDAIINFIINASHAIETNGNVTIITKNISLSPKQANLLQLKETDYITLVIEDDGIGMNKQTLSKVFDPFFSTKGNSGTGLGLSQVYGFVQRCGGVIEVESKLKQGSKFTIYFPRHHSNKAITETNNTDTSIKKGHGTILVVDDEKHLCDMAGEILRNNGYNVILSYSAKEALGKLRQEKVDIVFSDVIMPGTNGYELAEEIMEKYPNMLIQLTSGYNEPQNLHKNKNISKINILQKPYGVHDLLLRIKDLMDKNN